MNIDQRLHRAAHDLRELEIDVPPLDVGSTTTSRSPLRGLGALVAATMLFVFGAVLTVADVTPENTAAGQVAAPGSGEAQVAVIEPIDSADDSGSQLSPHEELAMITSLSQRSSITARSGPTDSAIPSGAT